MTKQKSLPNGLSFEQFSKAYRRDLERHSDAIIAEIKAMLSVAPNDHVTGAQL